MNIFSVFSFQLLSETQLSMMKVVNSLHDMLDSVHKEAGSERGLLKADLLQRAPVRSGVLPRGCARGDGNANPYFLAMLNWAVGHNEPH